LCLSYNKQTTDHVGHNFQIIVDVDVHVNARLYRFE
jgi:hypothetical protein